jgi:hypothetical protein
MPIGQRFFRLLPHMCHTTKLSDGPRGVHKRDIYLDF